MDWSFRPARRVLPAILSQGGHDLPRPASHEGARIRAYDPEAVANAKTMLKKVTYCGDPYSLVKGCDCLLVLTEWDEFRKLDFKRIKKLMKHAIIFDGRNLYHDQNLVAMGFEYYGIGRGDIR